jgi:uncharacterized Zn-binding protein involved in type VI secretion
MAKRVACLGDGSDHGGTLTSTNQDDKFMIGGLRICANGCNHNCPIPGHGTTAVTAVITVGSVNGKLIITTDATAGCGAKITPPDRKFYL